MPRKRGWRRLLVVIYRDNLPSRRLVVKFGFREVAALAESDEKVVLMQELKD